MSSCLPPIHPLHFYQRRTGNLPLPLSPKADLSLVQLLVQKLASCAASFDVHDLLGLPAALLASLYLSLDLYGLLDFDRRITEAHHQLDLNLAWRRIYLTHRGWLPKTEQAVNGCWRKKVAQRQVQQALRHAADCCLRCSSPASSLAEVSLPMAPLLDDEIHMAAEEGQPCISLSRLLTQFSPDVTEVRLGHVVLSRCDSVEVLAKLTGLQHIALQNLFDSAVENVLQLLCQSSQLQALTIRAPSLSPAALETLVCCNCGSVSHPQKKGKRKLADVDDLWYLPSPKSSVQSQDFDLYCDIQPPTFVATVDKHKPYDASNPSAQLLECSHPPNSLDEDVDSTFGNITPDTPSQPSREHQSPGISGNTALLLDCHSQDSTQPIVRSNGIHSNGSRRASQHSDLPQTSPRPLMRPCVTELNLVGVKLSTNTMMSLASVLSHCPALHHITLASCLLVDADVSLREMQAVVVDLGHAIGSAHRLRSISLPQCILPADFVAAMCCAWDVVEAGPVGVDDFTSDPFPISELERLTLSGLLLPPGCINAVLSAIAAGAFPNLIEVDVSNVELKAQGAQGIVDLLRCGCPLTSLDVSDCGLQVQDSVVIMTAVVQCRSLRRLKISHNILGPTVSPTMARLLNQDQLEYLDLSHTALGPTSLTTELFEALARSTSLHTLRLAGNRLGDVAGVSLAQCIAQKLKQRIRTPCSGYPVLLPTQEAYVQACVTIPNNIAECSLTSLDVSRNRFSALVGFALCCAIAGEDVARHKAVVQERTGAGDYESDPRINPFPQWNTELKAADWLPVNLQSPQLCDVTGKWGECSRHFTLVMHTLIIEGNHFGPLEEVIADALAARCRCIQLRSITAAVDHEP